ncbi:MAG: hypothetical protein KDA89_05540 [Planctomycetaceae bacterium]|nr:hypothetical protein [Planctomycetaceae bacterium]
MADARLDDRRHLVEKLALNGSGASFSDSELILQSYLKWGPRCTEHLLGDFAFVVRDPRNRIIFCARDRMGVKPFYYAVSTEQIVYSPDIESLLRVPGIDGSWDHPAIADYLSCLKFIDKDRTLYKGIRRLPPGHQMVVSANAEKSERYWFPEHAPAVRFRSDSDYDTAFVDLLASAVQDRLPADLQTGAHVSGGLDSSAIATLAARRLREEGRSLAAFCWSPSPADHPAADDERALIQSVCAAEGLTNSYHSIDAGDIIRVLNFDGATIPTTSTMIHEHKVQQQAEARGVRVMLSGWGGDELISNHGQAYLSGLVRSRRYRKLLQEVRIRGWKTILTGGVIPASPAWIQSVVGQFRPDLVRGSHHDISFTHPDLNRPPHAYWNDTYAAKNIRDFQLSLLNSGHITERMESWAIHGAKRSIEYRYPLLDSRVIEFALGLPQDQYIRGKQTRVLMRRALAGLVPACVLANRDKSDPARSKDLRSETQAALKTIGEQLAVAPWPDRSQFFDMPRLIERLTTSGSHDRGELRALKQALQFLNF